MYRNLLRTSQVLSFLLAAIATVITVSSCGNNVGQAKQGAVTGVVFKGLVSEAEVKAFSMDGARRGDELGTATTAEDGTFTVNVKSHAGPVMVCATRGTYVEEATGGLVQLGVNELCSLIENHGAGDTSTTLLTPLTTFHTSLTGCFFDAGRDATLSAASQHSALRLNDFFAAGQAGFDVRTTIPLNPTTGLAASLTAEAWAGILVAGLSESAKGYAVASGLDPGVRVTAATLTTALTQDIDDGACIFDGQTSTARLVQGTIDLDENTLRGSPQGLATSILRFLESDRNLSGIAQENVRDLVQTMQAHTSEIFGGGGGGADIDSPIVTYSEPTAGSTRGGTIRVTARAVDASRIVEFAFTAPDQAAFIASTFTCTDDTATDCTITGTLNTDLAPVVDGPLDILARAVDAAGNPTPQTLSIVVNNTLPTIQVATPQDEQPVDGVFLINATADDAEGIASLTVEIPGVGLCDDQPTSPCRDIQPANGLLQVAWDTTTLPEGNVTLLFHAVDAAGQEGDERVTVLVDNNDIGAITGFVDLGTPVFGATVTALDWTGRVRGAVLGTATSSETGAYRVELDDAEHASVLLVVTGGRYVDLATGVEFAVADGQELTTAVGAIAPGEVRTTNVNAWTTFAAARAKHTPAGGLEVDAINLNTTILSQHLRRVPFGTPFSVAATKSADLTSEVVQIDDQRAVLALSHAGLSRLASELSVAQAGNIGAVSTTGLIQVLAEDLQADPTFDGIGATDFLTIGPDLVRITSLTTRFDLAAALDRYLKAVPLIGANVNRNVSSITAGDALRTLLYDALAEDRRTDLYLDPPRSFDTTAPVITLEFAGNNRDAQPGDPLRDTVQINGTALDDSALATFGGTLTIDGTFIPDDDNNSTNAALRVFIATDILPNAADAAGACPNATDAADVSVLQDSVCLCAIAEDIQNNVAEKILCFTRPLPTVAFEPPSPLAGSSVTGAAIVAARVTSGFDLQSFDVVGAAASLSTTRPTADTLQVTVPTSFVDVVNRPNIVVGIQARDIAGRTTPTSLTFTRPAPTTSITSPTPNAIVSAGQQAQLSASVTSGYDLDACTAALSSSPTQVPPALQAPTRSGTECTYSQSLDVTSLPDATWTLTVNATDIAGRAATPATRTFIVDDSAPTVSSVVLAGVSRSIKVVNGNRFIGADNPVAPAPRTSTYTATVTVTDNFAVSRVVFRIDAPGAGADLLFCVDGVVGACSSQTAVLVGGELRACSAANGCTIGGTKTGNSFAATVADARDDGPRTISVEAFDVNGNQRTDGASVILEKDTVAPLLTWKQANQQTGWDDMAPTAGVLACRTVDNGTDFRSSCIPTPAASLVTGQPLADSFFVGSTPTTPARTIHAWRNLIRATQFSTVLPTVTAATVGDGTVTVRFQAGATCPAAAALTQSKGLTNGAFALGLAAENLGFDLTTVNNVRVCVRAVPVDAAGNEGVPADIFVKWDTIDPPVNVLVNPPDDADVLPTLGFASAAGDPRTFITGAKQVSMFHAFISNPYAFTTKIKLAPTAALVVDVADTLTQHTQKSLLQQRWPGNANTPLESPASTTAPTNGLDMSWTTSGLASTDDDANNQVFVKVTTDNASRPTGTKVSDTAPSVGVVTRASPADRIDRSMVIDAFRFFAVSTAGVIGAELAPDAAGFITVPAATSAGLPPRLTASVVVAVAVGKVATGTTYQIAAPGESIPVMLRGGASTGVSPDITATRFVVTRHPLLNAAFNPTLDIEGLSGFHVHSRNGDGSSGSPLLCASSGIASRAECTFYKRWFELEELRLVWNVGDGTTLKKLFTLSTKEPSNTVYVFSNATALVEPHPFFAGFEGSQQELRVSDAP